MGEGHVPYVRAGGIWEIPIPSTPFCCEATTAIKKVREWYEIYVNFNLNETNKFLEKSNSPKLTQETESNPIC